MKAEWYRQCEQYMLAHTSDGAHDAEHIYRVLYAALSLGKREKSVDWDVLITSALLHDVGREVELRTGENHALAGARMAKEFLLQQGASEQLAGRVADCVRTHRFTSDDAPATVEARILYDADKLDVAGALGMARSLLYEGRKGYPIYSLSADGEVMSGEEKTPSLYAEYRRKLCGVSAKLLTQEGRRRAERRSAAANDFFRAIQAEVAAGEAGCARRLLPASASAKQRRVLNMALMLSEGVDRNGKDAVVDMALGRVKPDETAAGRSMRAAIALDEAGALGVAQKLMDMGAKGERLSTLLEAEWKVPELPTAQANGIARVRTEAAQAFLEALRAETREGREEGQAAREKLLEE